MNTNLKMLIRLTKGIFLASCMLASGVSTAVTLTYSGLYSKASQTYLTNKKEYSIEGPSNQLSWLKLHPSQTLMQPKLNLFTIRDTANDTCIENNDDIMISTNRGTYISYNPITKKFLLSPVPQSLTIDNIVNNNGSKCLNIYSRFTLNKAGTKLDDNFEGIDSPVEFTLLRGGIYPPNFVPVNQYSEEISILTYYSTFWSGRNHSTEAILAGATAYMPKVNGDDEKYRFYGHLPHAPIYEGYCIPNNTFLKIKNIGMNGWYSELNVPPYPILNAYTPSIFKIQNLSYAGQCIEEGDKFSLVSTIDSKKRVAVDVDDWILTTYETDKTSRYTFVYATDPNNGTFFKNTSKMKFDIVYEALIEGGWEDTLYGGNHELSLSVDGKNLTTWGIDEWIEYDHDRTIGKLTQYSYRSNKVCDNSFFFLKKNGAATYIGATEEGSSKLKTNQTKVTMWDTMQFRFSGEDNGKCFANGQSAKTGNNYIRMWDPEDDAWGHWDLKTPLGEDPYVQVDSNNKLVIKAYFK